MNHNLYPKKAFPVSAIAMALLLAGCNGDSDNSNGGTTESPATISAQNATFVTGYTDSYQVDLSDKVSVSDGQSFALQRVTSLSATPECQPLSQSAQSFTIAADRSKSCDYRYQVMVTGDSASSASDSAITRVAVSRDASDGDEVDLPVIQSTTMVEQQIDVNVYQQLMIQSGYTVADGFTLSDVVTLPYSSNVATVDADSHVIAYTPPAGFEGVERILFSYHNDTSGEVLLGTLDVIVSRSANQGLSIEKGATYEQVEIDQVVPISIEPYVTSMDGDDYQLIQVDSFNAATTPVSGEIDNKAFYFETSKFGAHYVSFTVADHNGAYAMGLLKVPAYDPKNTAQWSGINYQSLFFSAPVTTQYAAGEMIEYKRTLTDDTYSPAVDLALFDFTQAQRYCGTLGRMPTSDELVALSGRDVQGTDNWPVAASYLASDEGIAKVINLQTGSADDYYGDDYLVSCIEGGLTAAPDDDVIANGSDQAEVVFSMTGKGQQPMPAGIAIEVTTDSETAQLESPSIMTDDEGRAIARISNTKSESITVCGESGMQKSCTVTAFVGDPATAEVSSGSLDVKGWTPGSEQAYPVYATVTDENGNAVNNAYVTFELTSDSNTPSAQLLSSSGLTDQNGVASVNIVNPETYPSDETQIVAAHTNTSGNDSDLTIAADWGTWQWATPLDVKLTNYASFKSNGLIVNTSTSFCQSEFGEEYRTLSSDEQTEYINAVSNGELVPDSASGDMYYRDPILLEAVAISQVAGDTPSRSGVSGRRYVSASSSSTSITDYITLRINGNYTWNVSVKDIDSYDMAYLFTGAFYDFDVSSTHNTSAYNASLMNIHGRSRYRNAYISSSPLYSGGLTSSSITRGRLICVAPLVK